MKKLIYILSLIALVNVTHAQLMGGEGAPALQKGDIIVGGKLALGAVYGANVGFIAGAEYGFKQGFLNIPKFPASLGIGGSIGYSGYSKNYAHWGDYSYSNFLILGSGYWHVDLLKKKEVDTYVVLNLGFNITSVDAPNIANAPDYDSTDGGLVFGTGIGIKYYFIPNLAAVAEVGFGMGLLRIGIDFRI